MDSTVALNGPLLTVDAAREAAKHLTADERFELREVGRRTLAKLRKQRRDSIESNLSSDDGSVGHHHRETLWALSLDRAASYASSAGENSCNLSEPCLHSEDSSEVLTEQVDCLMAHVDTLLHEREQWQSEAVRLRRELDSLQRLLGDLSLE